jgi:very-short-patch-repair endonuclease
VRAQHGVLTRGQLLERFSPEAIKHRVRRGRLHPVHRGVYAIGRPDLDQLGLWLAAVLACGPGAALSHFDAAALYGVLPRRGRYVHVTVPGTARRRRSGIRIHHSVRLGEPDRTVVRGLPVTTPARTLVDLASAGLGVGALERAINEFDKLDLIDPAGLSSAIELQRRRPGVVAARAILHRHAFALTASELERRFLALVRRLALPLPVTGPVVNGFKVDFFWPQLGLVVETDGLRYHRTPAQQARDRRRDQAHVAAGLTQLRFTHHQVARESAAVGRTLRRVIGRLQR